MPAAGSSAAGSAPGVQQIAWRRAEDGSDRLNRVRFSVASLFVARHRFQAIATDVERIKPSEGTTPMTLRKRQPARTMILGTALLAIGLVLAPAVAPAAGPLYGSTWPSKVTGKLGRGIGNVLFCWVEIPIEINEEVQNTDPFTGSIVGLVEGIWYTIRRFGLAVVDIITFPIDIYGNNYQSIQRTEFPFIDEVE
jgi:putative exosortase-associated protein (TIGR04073 family)